MGHLHRPQNITPLVYYPREYYYARPQTIFGPSNIIPSGGAIAIVQTSTLTAIIQTGTLTAIVQTGTS